MRKRILVIEDDASIAEVVTLILEQEQYRVTIFADDSFIGGLYNDIPGLILLDLWLSGVNGKNVCLWLKQHEHFHTIPVVIISANRDIRQYAEEACADDYLAKPFDVEDLLHKVKTYYAA